MPTENLVPTLRFPQFDSAWSTHALKDVASFSKGKGISKADIDENGEIECIRYGELYTEYSEVIDKVKSRTRLNPAELILSEANDVIIPASGETQIDIATASCVLRKGIALGGDLNIIRSQVNGIFLSYYLNNARKQDIASLAQGVSVVHLYSSQLKTLILKLPQLEEQIQIGSFFSAVDKHIQLLKQKIALLETYKRGVMQKVFPQAGEQVPILRFKDDNGIDFPDWEEKKIGEVLSIGSGRDYKHLNQGGIPVYGTGGYMTSVDEFLYEGDSVGIGRKGTIDKPIWLTGQFWTVDTLFYTHSFNGVLPYFVYLIFQRINWRKYNEASGVPSLSKSTLEKIKINLPSSNEQQKITSFIISIDAIIAKLEQQLGHLQNFKKGLLQQMFI